MFCSKRDVNPGHRVLGEHFRLEIRRAEEAALANLSNLDALPQELLEVVPHQDLAGLAALLGEAERVLGSLVLEALEGQLGDRPDAGGGVDEYRQDGAVAEADRV
jgi:hypothetical protein